MFATWSSISPCVALRSSVVFASSLAAACAAACASSSSLACADNRRIGLDEGLLCVRGHSRALDAECGEQARERDCTAHEPSHWRQHRKTQATSATPGTTQRGEQFGKRPVASASVTWERHLPEGMHDDDLDLLGACSLPAAWAAPLGGRPGAPGRPRRRRGGSPQPSSRTGHARVAGRLAADRPRAGRPDRHERRGLDRARRRARRGAAPRTRRGSRERRVPRTRDRPHRARRAPVGRDRRRPRARGVDRARRGRVPGAHDRVPTSSCPTTRRRHSTPSRATIAAMLCYTSGTTGTPKGALPHPRQRARRAPRRSGSRGGGRPTTGSCSRSRSSTCTGSGSDCTARCSPARRWCCSRGSSPTPCSTLRATNTRRSSSACRRCTSRSRARPEHESSPGCGCACRVRRRFLPTCTSARDRRRCARARAVRPHRDGHELVEPVRRRAARRNGRLRRSPASTSASATATRSSCGGPTCSRGYWEQPEATVAAFDVDGWFATGDIGAFDDDGYLQHRRAQQGADHLRRVQRVPARSRGRAARDSQVSPTSRWSARRRTSGARSSRPWWSVDGAVDADALLEYAAGELAPYKRPRVVRFVDELPRNALGKVLRSELVTRHVGEPLDRRERRRGCSDASWRTMTSV